MKNIYIIIIAIFFCFSCGKDDSVNLTTEDDKQEIARQKFQMKFDIVKDSSTVFIRSAIENQLPEEHIVVNGIKLYSSIVFPQFYIANEFQPSWIRNPDSLNLVTEMIKFIQDIEFHGLQPQDYHYDSLIHYYKLIQTDSTHLLDPHFLATFDMWLSDAFFMVSSHLYNGKVNPELLEAEWGIQRNKPESKLNEKLQLLIETGNVGNFMTRFYPPHPGYVKMVEHARTLSSKIDQDFRVEIPQSSITVHILEDTLYNEQINAKLKFLGFSDSDTLNYNDSLTDLFKSIKRLQYHHGFNQDGAIGKNTYHVLNLSMEKRLKKLYVNMERLRWLSDSLERQYIIVNIADFTLDYIRDKDTLLHMRTVVGKEFRQTPVFNAKMSYLVFSPTWTVPPGILRNDVLPAVAKNVGYLASKNMDVLDASGNIVDPQTIDWNRARKGSFSYRIRQRPGPQNSLGKVKFMFPNKHSVYLHDTPSRDLFAKDGRTFSSGCIRIEKPFDLARLLLEGQEKWNDEAILQAMTSNKEQSVILKEKVGVYIYYLTAWGMENGEIHFRNDIYNRDDEVYVELKKSRKM